MDLHIHDWRDLTPGDRDGLLARPALRDDRSIMNSVRDIVDRVRREGDTALNALTEQFDGVRLESLEVTGAEFKSANASLSVAQKNAIELAIDNVRRFHEAQRPVDIRVETTPGVRCERLSQPLDAVGLYVPAGSAPLPSTAVMLAVPAAIAGCPLRIMCTPPRRDGSADPAVLVAAQRSGVEQVFKTGGAQAIAAMAFGTASVPRVRKLFGPGNAWVTAAKRLVAAEPDGPAIDMPAGPSEVLVIADATANPEFVAADLLSQAEHGPDSQVVLVAIKPAIADKTRAAVLEQLERLPRRHIASAALQHARLIVVENRDGAVALSNEYAPEHLILQVEEPEELLKSLRNAGSVFVGPWSPESAGDYCSGTNHVLPTYGQAATYSGLGIDQFMRHMTVQTLSRHGLAALAPAITELAELEGLGAHAAAVRVRLAASGGKS